MLWKKKSQRPDTVETQALRCGENSYQKAGFTPHLTDDPLALHRFEKLSDKSPSYRELAGLDIGLDTLSRVVESLRPNQKGDPKVCILVCSSNPIGIGLDAHSGMQATERALAGYPSASDGCIVVTNYPLTIDVAERLEAFHPSLVAVPVFNESAKVILKASGEPLLYQNPGLSWANVPKSMAIRGVRGGLLKQETPDFTLPDLLEFVWTGDETDGATEDDLCVAFAAAWCSQWGGHEIAFSNQGTLLVCAGGPTLYDAIQTALSRGQLNHSIKGSVFVTSRPLTVGPAFDALLRVGCRAGLIHEGSPDEHILLKMLRSEKVNVGLIPGNQTGICRT